MNDRLARRTQLILGHLFLGNLSEKEFESANTVKAQLTEKDNRPQKLQKKQLKT